MNLRDRKIDIKPAALRRLGLTLTVLWLAIVLYVVRWPSTVRFDLQHLTDFVVLAFTPLVVFWLILQTRELQRLVAEQRSKDVQSSQPLLRMKVLGIGGTVEGQSIVHFVLLNHGRTCTDVILSFDDEHESQHFDRVSDGGELPFNLALPTEILEPVIVTASYLDQQLLRGTKRFIISGGDSSFQVSEVGEANPH